MALAAAVGRVFVCLVVWIVTVHRMNSISHDQVHAPSALGPATPPSTPFAETNYIICMPSLMNLNFLSLATSSRTGPNGGVASSHRTILIVSYLAVVKLLM